MVEVDLIVAQLCTLSGAGDDLAKSSEKSWLENDINFDYLEVKNFHFS
jgi:hypothetical protein